MAHGGRWEEERSTWKRREETNPPAAFPFFARAKNEDRACTGEGKGEGKEDKGTGSRCGAKTRKREKRTVERC